MHVLISTAASVIGSVTNILIGAVKNGSRRYFMAIDNMYAFDDIFDHETFR